MIQFEELLHLENQIFIARNEFITEALSKNFKPNEAYEYYENTLLEKAYKESAIMVTLLTLSLVDKTSEFLKDNPGFIN